MSVKASEVSFNEAVLRLAVVHSKVVEFRYVKDTEHAPEVRRFIPESINVTKQGEVSSFVGYDPDRQALRTFRLDRIRGDVRFV